MEQTLQRSDESCRGSQAFRHARGHFSSLARFARRTKKKGRVLVKYEARRPLTKKPNDYKLDTGCSSHFFFSFGFAKVYFSLKQWRAGDGVL